MQSREMLETQNSSKAYTRYNGICAMEMTERCYSSTEFIGKLKEF